MKNFAYLALVAMSFSAPIANASLLWQEDFSGQEGKGLSGDSSSGIITNMTGITKWSVSGAGGIDDDTSLNWWMVTNGVFQGQDVGDNIGYWRTEAIDVSSEAAVEFSTRFSQLGAGLSGSGNYLKLYYQLDTGAAQQELGIIEANQSTYDGMAWTSSAVDVSSATSIVVEARIKTTTPDNGWGFDDVTVATYVPPSDVPPTIVITPANRSVSATVGQPYAITVTATEPDGDTVTLGANSMPDGATFSPNPTSGVASVTNVFSWTPTAKGSEDVTFYTSDDADGAGDSATVTFSVGDASSIMITEIMQKPAAVSYLRGEWFEIYNRSRTAININGWTLKDDGSNSHVIDNGGELLVPAWGFAVLGRDADPTTNGNVALDYEYNGFTLTDSGDEIVLLNASSQEMARVNYDGGPEFPTPAGASMYLTDPDLDQNTGANWATSASVWPGSDGDSGTPGAVNDQGDWSPVIPGAILIIR